MLELKCRTCGETGHRGSYPFSDTRPVVTCDHCRVARVIMHTVSGSNFHGHYSIELRGPAAGFILSTHQIQRLSRAMHPSGYCLVRGGHRHNAETVLRECSSADIGTGPDPQSARLVDYAGISLELIPHAYVAEGHDAGRARFRESCATMADGLRYP